MVFSSIPFIFFFLPLTLAAYHVAPRRLKNGVLLLASLAFYLGIIAWFVRHPDLIILLAFGLVLAAYDFLRSFLSSRQNGG